MKEITEFKEWAFQQCQNGRIPHSIILNKTEIEQLSHLVPIIIARRLEETQDFLNSIKKCKSDYIAYVKEDYYFVTYNNDIVDWNYSQFYRPKYDDYKPPCKLHIRDAKDMQIEDCRFFVKVLKTTIYAKFITIKIVLLDDRDLN